MECFVAMLAQDHCFFVDLCATTLRDSVQHAKETWTSDLPDGAVTTTDPRVEVKRRLGAGAFPTPHVLWVDMAGSKGRVGG